MIVWGGDDGSALKNDGWRYNPNTNAWAPLPQTGDIPTARAGHAMTWTGTGFIVWGGSDGDHTNTGGRYEMATGAWTATTTTGAPAAKAGATAVWTGTEMIVWGGRSGWNGQYATQEGGRYDPTADTWESTSLVDAPGKRGDHVAVWTGTSMIIFAGYNGTSVFLKDGKNYVPPVSLSGGVYNGTISVSDPGASNSPQTVDVTLNVNP
jgi:N-acetylneuraminic acid mutarotase